jgi:pimeloyl-ACP methyl ester carboxylesterase
MDITSQYFTLNGLKMHALVTGPETGRLVILLHGFPQFSYAWRTQMQTLAAAGYRVVAPDQRGYNLTDKTPPYDVDTLVQDVVNLIQANGRERALVAGHDWGAAVAWALAMTHPERVEKLMVFNVPHLAVMARALLGGNATQMRRSWYIAYFQVPFFPEWALAQNNYQNLWRAVRNTAVRGTFTDEDRAEYVRAWSQPGALSAMIGWYRGLKKFAGAEMRQRFAHRVQPPTVIVWGEQDFALGVELAEESVNWLENGRLVKYPNATHWVVDEFPAEVSQELLRHFSD